MSDANEHILKPLACNLCGRRFGDRHSLDQHYGAKHWGKGSQSQDTKQGETDANSGATGGKL